MNEIGILRSPVPNEFVPLPQLKHSFSICYRGPHMKRAQSYPASKIPDEFKSILARLYVIQHAKGKSRNEFVNELKEARAEVSERQLDRWVARIESNDEAISPDKLTGAAPSLCRERRDTASGWVLDELEHGQEVHLESYRKFVFAHFGVDICPQTALNYLKEYGFTMKVLKKKSSGFTLDLSVLRTDLWNWVKSRQNEFNKIPGSKPLLVIEQKGGLDMVSKGVLSRWKLRRSQSSQIAL